MPGVGCPGHPASNRGIGPRATARGKCNKAALPRKTQEGVVQLPVPESDTGRPPEYGKVLEITLVKELGILAS